MDTATLVVIMLIFLLGIGILSYLGYRQTKSSKDYLVAGREIHPFVMAMSYGAAFISTSAIVGFAGIAGLFGFGLLWLPLCNIVIGIFIAFVYFGKRTRKMGHNLNAHTFPEFLGRRYRSHFIKIAGGGIIFLGMPLYSAVVLIGGAKFIEKILAVDFNLALLVFAIIIAFYVTLGGLKGVMYIDALLGSIMFFGMLFLLCMTYSKLGGITQAHEKLTSMAHLVPGPLQKLGHQGWTAMPAAGSQWWWVLVSTLILGVGIGVLAQPQLAVRFMTIKSNREINRGVLVGSLFILVTAGVAYVVGALSNAYFYELHQKLAIDVVANKNVDEIMPTFIKSAMPKWFVYIFAVALLSAGMSTLSSLFHTIGTSAGHDIFRNFFKTGKSTIKISKIGIIVGIIFSVVLAYKLPGGVVARGTAMFFGICAGAFLPSYAAALYWRRATKAGAVASMMSGLGVSLFCLAFLHMKEAKPLGICQAIFGKPVLVEQFPWPLVDPILFSLPVSAAVLIIVSLLTEKLTDKHIERCFDGVKPSEYN